MQQKFNIAANLVLAVLICLSSGCCHDIKTYLNKKSFMKDTGAVSLTGPLKAVGGPRVEYTQGQITYLDGDLPSEEAVDTTVPPSSIPVNHRMFVINTPADEPITDGAVVTLSDNEDLDIKSDKLVNAMGFVFVQPLHCNMSNGVVDHPSKFTITLMRGKRKIKCFYFTSGPPGGHIRHPDVPVGKAGGQPNFIGVVSRKLFDTLRIREQLVRVEGNPHNDDYMICNQYFGQVYGR